MQHNQTIHMAGFQRPERFPAQDRDIGLPRRPLHHALRPRHQRNHPARIGQVGPQQRHGKAESPPTFAPAPGARTPAAGSRIDPCAARPSVLR